MAYDSAHGQVVLFGGCCTAGVQFGDTWVWDGANWTQKMPATSPSDRSLSSMAYDSAHNQLVLFSGYSSNQPILADTWLWDGNNWTLASPANAPSPRYGHTMAYDSVHGQVVLFGGFDFNLNTILNDTWVWDGANWTQKSPANSPPARYLSAMVYDSARMQAVLFGGRGNTTGSRFSDTWTWDGNNWMQQSPINVPPARQDHAMAYDSIHGQSVLFGGFGGASSSTLGDTWTWDGTNWNQQVSTLSVGRYQTAMANDAAQDQVVLFGGHSSSSVLGDTWLWLADHILDVGTTNTIAKFISAPNVGNSVMFENAGRIGLGNTNPLDFMHVTFTDTSGVFTGYAVQNLGSGAASYSGMLFYDQNNMLGQFQGFNNMTHEYRINNIATTGSINFMLGSNSKFQVRTDGDINITGNLRKAGDVVLAADTGIHIGTTGTHTSFFAAGVTGVGITGGVPVVVDGNGQLGVVLSSRRFKEDIRDMADASSCLFDLRPVTYRYRQPYADGSKPLDFGLVAEEVAAINPELVFKSKDGQIETVQYQKLTPMLLNELQKQVELGRQQDETIRDLVERLAAVEASLPGRTNATTTGNK